MSEQLTPLTLEQVKARLDVISDWMCGLPVPTTSCTTMVMRLQLVIDSLAAISIAHQNANSALDDIRLLAARHRNEEWAQHALRFCARAGVTGSPLRDLEQL